MQFPGVALVTGAGSGIGRATAQLFAAEGCKKIAIADINASGLEETKRIISNDHKETNVLVIQTDVSSEESVNAMVKTTVEQLGRVDYACNVAGILIPGFSTDYSVSQWDKQFSVNTRGMWLCQRAELKYMTEQEPLKAPDSHFEARGSIVNVASMAGLRVYENLPAYCSSKHAVIGFTKADGLGYAKHKIRVNAICPGVIKTPMLGEVPEGDDQNVDEMTKDMAMKRQGLPEEVAECLVWMSSGRASFVTATTLAPNGGMVGG